ncbi:MAG: protein kinase [Candidatus Brocadiae bacterium]|nr:protein kinase [Candidatus Brocadiia bacterium]
MPNISAKQITAILQASGMVPASMMDDISNLILNTKESNLIQELVSANLLTADCLNSIQLLLGALEKNFVPSEDGRSLDEAKGKKEEVLAFAHSEERKKDILFACQALSENLCKIDDVNKCFLEQAEMKTGGTTKSLLIGQIMVKNHYIPVDRFVKIHREIEKKIKEVGWDDLIAKEKKIRITVKDGIIRLLEGYIPEKFGPYRILEEVARGGMGVVYKAWDAKLKRHVALKVLKAWENAPLEEIQRFHREARLASRLTHPNIVTIYDAGNENGVHYFTMDFVEGQVLSEYLKKNTSELREKLNIIREIALALDYAHGQGVIHRDVKPGNIILDMNKHALLTDFGLAKGTNSMDSRRLTKSGEAIGTPSYMSPEQAKGSANLDARSDIYSLGAVLYEILAGSPPFEGNTVGAVISAVISQEPIPPGKIKPDLHPHIETICLKAMAKDPDYRYQTAKEMADDIDRFLYGDGIKAKPVNVVKKAWKKIQRNSALILSIVSFFIFFCSFVGTVYIKEYFLSKKAKENYKLGLQWLEKKNYRSAVSFFQEAAEDREIAPLVRKILGQSTSRHIEEGIRTLMEYKRNKSLLENQYQEKTKEFKFTSEYQIKKDLLFDLQMCLDMQKENQKHIAISAQNFFQALMLDPFNANAIQGISQIYAALPETKEKQDRLQESFFLASAQEKTSAIQEEGVLSIESSPEKSNVYLFSIQDLYLQRALIPYNLLVPVAKDRKENTSLWESLYSQELNPSSYIGQTPIEIASLPKGEYLVVVAAEQFLQQKVFVRISPKEKKTVKLNLKPDSPLLKDFSYVEVPGADRKYDYYLSVSEVTCGQYQKFLNDPQTILQYNQWQNAGKLAYIPRTRQKKLWEYKKEGFVANCDLSYPVSGISWEDAIEYCRWLTQKANNAVMYRLPTCQEWQWIAGYVDKREYPWGNFYDVFFYTPYLQRKIYKSQETTLDISPYGIKGMGGNVSEWCQDDTQGLLSFAIVCGGNWQSLYPESFKIHNIMVLPKGHTGEEIGFRVMALVPR